MRIALEEVAARHPAARNGAAPALQPLNLTVDPGEQIAVIGPSGAGKTTLLHVLACALRPMQGRLLLDETDPWALPVAQLQRLRGRLFLAPQTPPLPPRQRVITATLAARLPQQSLWSSLRSLAYPSDIDGAHAVLTQFDLGDKLWDRVDRLSGGERQRVGLARALLAPAALWLIDEPLSALDPTRARQAIDSLTQAARARGVTIVATLHQVDVALARFDRVIGMREGALAFDLPGAQVTQDQLKSLYGEQEYELAAAPQGESPAPALPASVMYCR